MDRQAAIEKNRTRLLRVVMAWLVLAIWMRRFHRVLPVRLSNRVGFWLWKAEAATGLLIKLCTSYDPVGRAAFKNFFCAADRFQAGLGYEIANTPLSLYDIVLRLKAMRSILRRLSPRRKAVGVALLLRNFAHDTDVVNLWNAFSAPKCFAPP